MTAQSLFAVLSVVAALLAAAFSALVGWPLWVRRRQRREIEKDYQLRERAKYAPR